MLKTQLTPDEVKEIDLWIERFQEYKFDFDFPKLYQQYQPIKGHADNLEMDRIYKLLAHTTNILEYNNPPQNTRMSFTEKGVAVLEADGYENWKRNDEAEKQYLREAPGLQRALTLSTQKTNTHLRYNMWIVAGIALLALIVSIAQCVSNSNSGHCH